MGVPATPSPVYIPGGDAGAFGWLHLPRERERTDTGVLFSPPFGWEEFCTYRGRRSWATHLQERGHPALRIDLPSTGDSPGRPQDPSRLQAWSDSVARAAAWMRENTGCSRLAVIGIGLGGLVAVGASGCGAEIDDLVLWSVPARGRTLIRELRAFARLNAEVDPADAEGGDEPAEPGSDAVAEDGSLEVGGFLLSTATVADLEALDLTTMELSGGPSRVMMLERDTIPVDRRLREHLVQCQAQVEVLPGPGFTAFTAHPQESRPPLAEFGLIDEWLARAPEPAGKAQPVPGPPSTQALMTGAGGDAVKETPIEIAQPFGRLPGILAEPVSGTRAPVCALFLNAGALRRIGPGRMWVDVARRWAASGIPSVRLDLEGIGEADGDGDAYVTTEALYVEELVDQTLATMDTLVERGMPPRFVLVGLCSGAYWSFQAAARDGRVASALLLNPRALFWDAVVEDSRDMRRAAKVMKGSSWRRLFRGEITRSQIGRAAGGALRVARRPGAALAWRRRQRARLAETLDVLERNGTNLLLAFGGREPLLDELERSGQLEAMKRRDRVELRSIPGADHTLRPIRTQRLVAEMLDEALEQELARAQSPSHKLRR